MLTKFETLVNTIRTNYRFFKVITKEDSKFMKFLFKIMLMKYWNPRFMEDYTTVILHNVYMPKRLINTGSGYAVLRHEYIHIKDAYKTGIIPFFVSYTVLLPFVFTFRAFWEWRAYKESLRVDMETYGAIHESRITQIVKEFTGSQYLWMCPFPKFCKPPRDV